MCIQWTRVLYSVVLTRQSNPPISQFNRLYNEFTSVWSILPYYTYLKHIFFHIDCTRQMQNVHFNEYS